jgi:hypothetical protein
MAIMSFATAGTVKVKIEEVKFAEPKFAQGPNDFDICVRVSAIGDPQQTDWWRGEMSENYGRGNFATMKQSEITMLTLRKIGFEGNDLTTLAEAIVGKETTANVKATEKDDRTYYNVSYLGGGGDQPVEIDNSTMQARLAALTGSSISAQSTPPQQSAPASAPATDNPFA